MLLQVRRGYLWRCASNEVGICCDRNGEASLSILDGAATTSICARALHGRYLTSESQFTTIFSVVRPSDVTILMSHATCRT